MDLRERIDGTMAQFAVPSVPVNFPVRSKQYYSTKTSSYGIMNKNKDISMKTKYFSNSSTETLDDLVAKVDRWIINHKILHVIERKTSGPSNSDPAEFFIKLTYDDKPPRV